MANFKRGDGRDVRVWRDTADDIVAGIPTGPSGVVAAAATPAASIVLYDGYVTDSVLSLDGLTVYAAGLDGTVRAYNAETGALLRSWDIGERLGGIAISPDGSTLVVAETEALWTRNDGWDEKTKITAYTIDIDSGTVTDHPTIVTGLLDAFQDVAVMNDGKAYFSVGIRGSGYTPIWTLDLATGEYRATSFSGYMPSLAANADRSRLLVSTNNLSDTDNYIIDIATQKAVGRYSGGGDGGAFGIEAFSEAAGLIIQRAGSGVDLYTTSLRYIRDLSDRLPVLLNTTGLAFDAEGESLYAIVKQKILRIDIETWTIVQTIDLPPDSWTFNLSDGEELIVGPESRFFLLYAGGKYIRVDNPAVADAISGSESSDPLEGTAAADTIFGFGGDDAIRGLDGDDRIDGGTGADTMAGGAGDDTYWVDTPRDRIIERVGEGHDTVISSVSLALAANVEALTLTGDARLNGTGNALDNMITGNDGANRLNGGDGDDVLIGGAGDDWLIGGVGADTLDGGAGVDTASYDASAAGVTVLLGASGSGPDGDVLISIENVVGSRFDDTIVGDAGDNRLTGGTGNDGLTGGDGADKLFGGAGDDVLDGGAGDDWIDGGSGVDLIVAGDGKDVVVGGIGDDTLDGGAGDDRIDGGAGADRLVGGDGADVLIGGGGRDVLTGGQGSDTFRFLLADLGRSAPTADTITDFNQLDRDRIVLVSDSATRFTFIRDSAFSGVAGEVRFQRLGSDTIVSLDADGDGAGDMAIRLTGVVPLVRRDFVFQTTDDIAQRHDLAVADMAHANHATAPLDAMIDVTLV